MMVRSSEEADDVLDEGQEENEWRGGEEPSQPEAGRSISCTLRLMITAAFIS